jgi:alanine-synthesizing transaminase
MSPAKRFREPAVPAAFDSKVKAIIADYDRHGKEYFRLYGADMPLTGHRNMAATETLAQTVREGWDYYVSETDCLHDFQEAVTVFQKRFRNASYVAEDILPVAGDASGWQVLHNVLLEPGDEIVAPEPAHYLWGPASQMYYLGSRIVQVPMVEKDEWEPDLDRLRAAITPRTRGIVVDHPNNPTGHIYSQKIRRAIIDIAGEHDIPVISDELYDLITYDGNEAPSIASESGDVPVIVLTSFSKFFMKPGWRIGYVAFHDPEAKMAETRNACTRLARTYGHSTTCISLPILVAATRILMGLRRISDEIADAQSIKEPYHESRNMVRKLQERRDYVYKRISQMQGISVVKSQASIYMFPHVQVIGDRWKTTEDFLLDLFAKKQVLFVPGTKFGQDGAGHFRTVILNDINVLEKAYNRLEEFLEQKG